jgi:hypothetical protein
MLAPWRKTKVKACSFLKKRRRLPGGNQKTFANLGRAYPEKPKPEFAKVFCVFFRNCPDPPGPCAGAGRGGATKQFASQGRKACFFEKKQQKTFDHFGCALSGWAQPRVAKVFWFLPGGRRLKKLLP